MVVAAWEEPFSGLMVLLIELSFLQSVVMKDVVLQCLGCYKSVF